MQYPLQLSFKKISLAEQFNAFDSTGAPILHVKQKLFKLKEEIQLFTDSSRQTLAFTLKADRILDFSPQFNLALPDGTIVGSIKRNGGKSIWRADYDVMLDGQIVGKVSEVDPWIKVVDSLLGELPVIGLLTGYFFNPSYRLSGSAGSGLVLIKKERAFMEGRFSLLDEGLSAYDEEHQRRVAALLSAVVLMERSSG